MGSELFTKKHAKLESPLDLFGAGYPGLEGRGDVLSSILKNFPTPFFAVDRNLVITYMNHHMESLTGFSREEVVNRMTCAELLRTVQCNTKDCVLRQAMEGMMPISGVRRTVFNRAGRRISVVVNASIITDSDHRVIGGFEALRDITAVVQAEQKIQLLSDQSIEGVLMVDDNQRIIYANSKMGEIYGRPKEQFIGMSVDELLPAQLRDMMRDLAQEVDEEHQEQVSFCSTIQPGNGYEQDSPIFEVCMAASRLSESVLTCMYFRDITRRIEIERQLRSANSFLHNIIKSSVDGIVVLDIKGNVLIWNEGAERILGYKEEELIGNPGAIYKFYRPEVARDTMRLMRSDKHGPPGKLNTTLITLIRKDGEEVPVNFSAVIIKEGDKEIGSVGIFTDMRENLKLQRNLEDTRIQLAQTEKIASLGRLAAGIAHEINNPLAGILIYSDMLAKEIGDHPRWSQDLGEIITQTLRCKQIVTRILEFSRSSMGQRFSFNPNESIQRCVELLKNQALFINTKVVLELEPDLPYIFGDPSQIQQVLTNLALNAAHAMNGKGQITITSRYDREGDEINIQVADTGTGIPAKIMDKVFEPFFTTKDRSEGTGLGLFVTYGIVQQHGGRITAGNIPSGGAVFTVALPLEPPQGHIEDETSATTDL